MSLSDPDGSIDERFGGLLIKILAVVDDGSQSRTLARQLPQARPTRSPHRPPHELLPHGCCAQTASAGPASVWRTRRLSASLLAVGELGAGRSTSRALFTVDDGEVVIPDGDVREEPRRGGPDLPGLPTGTVGLRWARPSRGGDIRSDRGAGRGRGRSAVPFIVTEHQNPR